MNAGDETKPIAHAHDLTPNVRRAFVALVALAVIGLPATFGLATAIFTPDRVWPAVICSGWVLGVAILGLAPLWLARTAPPAHQINARLGHVLLRLLFTAGGLIALLLYLPEDDRLAVAAFGLGWYAVTWVIDFGLLRPSPAQAAT